MSGKESGLHSKEGLDHHPPMQAVYPPMPRDGIGRGHRVERAGLVEVWLFAANGLYWHDKDGRKVYPAPAYAAGWRYHSPI